MASVSNKKLRVKSWKSAMQDVMAGEFTRKEAELILTECVNLADEALEADRPRREAAAKAEGTIDITPSWYEAASTYWNGPLKKGRNLGTKCPADVAKEFIRIGEIADWWEAKKAEAAQ